MSRIKRIGLAAAATGAASVALALAVALPGLADGTASPKPPSVPTLPADKAAADEAMRALHDAAVAAVPAPAKDAVPDAANSVVPCPNDSVGDGVIDAFDPLNEQTGPFQGGQNLHQQAMFQGPDGHTYRVWAGGSDDDGNVGELVVERQPLDFCNPSGDPGGVTVTLDSDTRGAFNLVSVQGSQIIVNYGGSITSGGTSSTRVYDVGSNRFAN